MPCISEAAPNPAARARLLEQAANGGADAAFSLGLDYDLGANGPEDSVAALDWYRRAAEAGLPTAEFNLATMLDSGRVKPRDPQAAALWYARAAARGHKHAAYNLAESYATGAGAPRNPAVAGAWYRAASAFPAAKRKLAALKRDAASGADDPASDAPLQPPVALGPVDQATLNTPVDHPEVELVWSAPAQAAETRFFVELVAVDDVGPPRRLFGGFADVTAMLVPLQGGVDRYAWRVYAVDAAGGRYVATPWCRFAVRFSMAGG